MSDLRPMFDALKPLLQTYQPPFVARVDSDARFELWSEKPIVIDGRKKKDVFFASLIVQKSYVGFYFMPVYAETELKSVFEPELLARLKGKSCFHIKKLDERLLHQIEAALKAGFQLYQDRGWV